MGSADVTMAHQARMRRTMASPAPVAIGLMPREPVVAGLKRLLRSEIATACRDLARLTPQGAPRTIHLVRRGLKRARTITRLLRPVLGDRARTLGTLLRDAGRALAGPRDATVLAETARATASRITVSEGLALLDRIAEEAASHAHADAAHAVKTSEALRLLGLARRELAGLPRRPSPAPLVIERIAATYRRARKGWRHAARSADSETLHDWRRRVQARLHVVRLFAHHWPEPIRRNQRRLDRLSEILGRDHDLAMLAARLPKDGVAAASVRANLDRRHARLVAKAFTIAGTLFKHKPTRIQRAWQAVLPKEHARSPR